MAYDPYVWRDSKSGGTPITAARLNAIEQGLDIAADVADAARTAATAAQATADLARGGINTAVDQASAAKTLSDALKIQVTNLSGQVSSSGNFTIADFPIDGDLNTYVTRGMYRVGIGGGWRDAKNIPAGSYGYGMLTVETSGNSVVQRYTPDGGGMYYMRATWNPPGISGPWYAYYNDANTTTNIANAVAKSQANRSLNVLDFGAKGDGATDDTAAIQAALDKARDNYNTYGAPQEVYFPGRTFLLSQQAYYTPNGVAGGCFIVMHSGTYITGSGTLKVKNGAWGEGSGGAVIRSDFTGISDAGISGIRIDGNKANNVSSDQNSNIVLNVNSNVVIRNVTSYNADGEGIQVLGGGYSGIANDVKIVNCHIGSVDRIGIQVSRFDNLLIDGNTVTYCGNNCIDIYGDQDPGYSNGTNFIISNNFCKAGLTGIFPETVSDGIVSNNRLVEQRESGIHVNRIHSAPTNILLMGNSIKSQPIGIYMTGDTGGVTIRSNQIEGSSTAGIQVGAGGANCSYVDILDNTINNVQLNGNPLVLFTGNQVAYCRSRGTITRNTDRGWDNVFYNLSKNVSNVVSPANAS